MNNGRYWQKRAERVRRYAVEMTDPNSKQAMVDLADSYELLAQRATSEMRKINFEAAKSRRTAPYGVDKMKAKTRTIAIAVNQKTRRRSSRSVKFRSVIAPSFGSGANGSRQCGRSVLDDTTGWRG
jgi:hypothetical protein